MNLCLLCLTLCLSRQVSRLEFLPSALALCSVLIILDSSVCRTFRKPACLQSSGETSLPAFATRHYPERDINQTCSKCSNFITAFPLSSSLRSCALPRQILVHHNLLHTHHKFSTLSPHNSTPPPSPTSDPSSPLPHSQPHSPVPSLALPHFHLVALPPLRVLSYLCSSPSFPFSAPVVLAGRRVARLPSIVVRIRRLRGRGRGGTLGRS